MSRVSHIMEVVLYQLNSAEKVKLSSPWVANDVEVTLCVS